MMPGASSVELAGLEDRDFRARIFDE